ncbi:putative NRPS-like protein biosynthetic cluster [Aspergillus brasiliensis]|uniref:NRPS-like protein biosynthetic cluster n=1 Tax=Aspergillus brasiliensis TaxID=319629 RepID=A0A9W5Z1P5_9EURO|nr:putative NRPS-like protein biosynthetic cluster [Aspergillus brasiliensis]GKZ47317.1 putative NRPS-like protein biosynthetic cluster [Aspergillus brasiliensis]
MDSHFSHNVAINPGAIAIDDGEDQWAYSDLDREVQRIASLLKVLDLPPEEPICILQGVGSETIIAQLAVIRAGLTCVPLEPSIPAGRLMSQLRDIGAKYILSNHAPSIDDDMVIIPISGEYHPNAVPIRAKSDSVKRVQLNGMPRCEYRSHILYTSGSSGKPKAVQIPESGILHLIFNSPATPLLRSDRMSVFNNPGFDMSIFDIFVPLVSGATLVIVPRSIITDPFEAQNFIAQKNITVSFLTAALFSIIAGACPTVFSGMRHVLTAGEVANMPAMKAVLGTPNPPQHLWNAYGPTEITIVSTMHSVTLDDFHHDSISIGAPFGDSRLFLADDSLNIITKPGNIGEILLGGPGLTAGYIGRPKENGERFFVDKAGYRLYRTGDFARWRPDDPNLLEFIGRADLQIKQCGFRVELGGIEQLFLSTDQLSAATVIQIQPETAKDEAFLVAFLIPADANTIKAKGMLEFIEQKVPAYAVPRDIVFCAHYPLTDNGKVDRKALAKQYTVYRTETEATHPVNETSTSTASILRSIWTSVLGQQHINEDDDFFSTLRGSSLQAAAAISRIRSQFGNTISMRTLYGNPRLLDLANYIDNSNSNQDHNHPNDLDRWMADAHTADDLSTVPNWQAGEEGRIFLTGATGFVGAHFLSRCLAMPTVKEVVCLARGKSGTSASERVQAVLERYNLWDKTSHCIHKLTVLNGDITLRHLGLTEDMFTWLTNWASVVFHLAAKVNYLEPYAAHYDANVLGTRHVMEVATCGRRKAFMYMSSIDVFGPTGHVLGTEQVLEDGPLEPHLPTLKYELGYAATKWVSEMMVRRAREHGLAAMIFRPGFILGDVEQGCGNPDDFFARFIMGCIQVGTFPRLPNQRMEYVSVDYVCEAMLHVAADNGNLGKTYNLVAPDAVDSVDLEETCRVINEAGYPVGTVGYWDWVRVLQERAGPDNPLVPLMPLLQETVLDGMSWLETHRNTVRFDCSNTVAALRDAPGIRYVPFDVGMLNRLLRFWRQKGFYQI